MKIIPGFPNYKITKDGHIWSMYSNRFLTNVLDDGYLLVSLHQNKKSYMKRVHRLVLETYVGPCPEGMQCCHNDSNKVNNTLKNLRWDTISSNRYDAVSMGMCVGETNGRSKLTEANVRMIVYQYRTGLFTQRALAAEYNVSQRAITCIVNKILWKHLWSV